MKRSNILLILLTITVSINSQAPIRFNYQAILRNADGTIMSNEIVSLQISIVNDISIPVYQETHNTETSNLGLVNLVIGDGVTSDDLSAVDWANGSYFLDITVNGINLGSNPLLSVPYALYAAAGNEGPQGPPGVQGEPGEAYDDTYLKGRIDTLFVSNTHRVSSGGLYSSIQSAIDSAMAGDVITVYPGNYSEVLIIEKKLTLQGVGKCKVNAIDIIAGDTVTVSNFDIFPTGATDTLFYINSNSLVNLENIYIENSFNTNKVFIMHAGDALCRRTEYKK